MGRHYPGKQARPREAQVVDASLGSVEGTVVHHAERRPLRHFRLGRPDRAKDVVDVATVPLKRKLSLPKSSSAFLCPLRLRSSLTPHRRLRVPCHQRFRRWTDVGEGEDLSSPSRHPLLVLVTPLVVDSLFRTLPLLRYS